MIRFSLPLFLLISLQILSCKSNDDDNNLSDMPEGIEIVDLETQNDCTLSACAEERIIRRLATDAEATIKINADQEFYISYTYGIDSRWDIYFCDLPIEFQQEGIDIQYSGALRDACGLMDIILGGQQIYFLHITDIKLKE